MRGLGLTLRGTAALKSPAFGKRERKFEKEAKIRYRPAAFEKNKHSKNEMFVCLSRILRPNLSPFICCSQFLEIFK